MPVQPMDLSATAGPMVWDPAGPLCPSNQPDACGVCTLLIETQDSLHQPAACAHVFHRDCFDIARQQLPADVRCPTCWEHGKYLQGCIDAKEEEESVAETVAGTIASEPPAPETQEIPSAQSDPAGILENGQQHQEIPSAQPDPADILEKEQQQQEIPSALPDPADALEKDQQQQEQTEAWLRFKDKEAKELGEPNPPAEGLGKPSQGQEAPTAPLTSSGETTGSKAAEASGLGGPSPGQEAPAAPSASSADVFGSLASTQLAVAVPEGRCSFCGSKKPMANMKKMAKKDGEERYKCRVCSKIDTGSA